MLVTCNQKFGERNRLDMFVLSTWRSLSLETFACLGYNIMNIWKRRILVHTIQQNTMMYYCIIYNAL